MKVLKNAPIIVTTLLMAAACSSDDSGSNPPPPAVDCNATGPSITLTASETGCGQDDGTIELAVTGGTGNLDVTIDPQPIGFTFGNNTFSSMEPGTYTVEVTDEDNCSTSENVVIGFTAGNVSYMDDIDPIVQARCAVSNCHDGSNPTAPDYTVFSNFQSRANNSPGGIRQRVKTDEMPQTGGPLTAEQKELLFCWIDEGALDN